jgi:hypothetical protein
MVQLNAHFDGKVIVRDEPLNLPANQKVRIQVEPIDASVATDPATEPKLEVGLQRGIVTYLAPDWEDPLPDDIWEHNKDDEKAGR